MKTNIKPKEAAEIINALSGGIVPRIGVQHIAVGRDDEINLIMESLEDIKGGLGQMKFWIGDFGAGKSFMFHLVKVIALRQKFVVLSSDFTPEKRLYDNQGRSLSTYRSLVSSMSINTVPDGGALSTILEKWMGMMIDKTCDEYGLSEDEVQDIKNWPALERTINTSLHGLNMECSSLFISVLKKFAKAYTSGDEELCNRVLRWLKGEYRTRLEARQDLGVRDVIDDRNWFDMLKNFSRLFVSMGYAGMVLNLDEAINLYKITPSSVRDKNYEKILSIYNDCYQGRCDNILVNIAGTRAFLENTRRGLFSYQALKTRLEVNKYAANGLKDFSQPVIMLNPLCFEDIFILLTNLRDIYNLRYGCEIEIEEKDIIKYMDIIYQKPGASVFLLPREVIRDFINIMSIIRQNPDADFDNLCSSIEIKDERPDDIEAMFSNIEEL